jgi:transposase
MIHNVRVQSWSELIAMKKPIPTIYEPSEELQRLLHTESDVQRHQRLQMLYLLMIQQARTRRQVARLLGVSRNTVGCWLAAYAAGGVARMLTIAKAPGKAPLLSPAIRQALRERLAQPDGFASYKAIWQWLQHEYGLSLAYKTVPKRVRYHLHAKLQGSRKAQIKKP